VSSGDYSTTLLEQILTFHGTLVRLDANPVLTIITGAGTSGACRNHSERKLSALETLIFDTQYAHYQIVPTVTSDEQP
jgi:hypothetical protein